jgi:hypothetical protein
VALGSEGFGESDNHVGEAARFGEGVDFAAGEEDSHLPRRFIEN